MIKVNERLQFPRSPLTVLGLAGPVVGLQQVALHTAAEVGALGVGAVGVWRAAALRRATLIDVWSSSTENKEVNNVTYTLIYLLLCSVAGYKWTG